MTWGGGGKGGGGAGHRVAEDWTAPVTVFGFAKVTAARGEDARESGPVQLCGNLRGLSVPRSGISRRLVQGASATPWEMRPAFRWLSESAAARFMGSPGTPRRRRQEDGHRVPLRVGHHSCGRDRVHPGCEEPVPRASYATQVNFAPIVAGTAVSNSHSWRPQRTADWLASGRNVPSPNETVSNIDAVCGSDVPVGGQSFSSHLIQRHRLGETLQCRIRVVAELEFLAGAEVGDDAGDEDLAGLSAVADAGGELDGSTEEVSVLCDGFSSVNADADANLVTSKVALDLECGFHRAGGRREGRHDPVAGVFHLAPAVGFKCLADSGVVAAEDFLGALVTEALSEGGR